MQTSNYYGKFNTFTILSTAFQSDEKVVDFIFVESEEIAIKDAYSEPCQTFSMERFTKIVNG